MTPRQAQEDGMEVRLLIHAEPSESGLAWWIESPDVVGFTGTGQHLVDARIRSELAIREILSERGGHDVSFSYQLVEADAPSEGREVARTGGALERAETAGGRPVAVVSAA